MLQRHARGLLLALLAGSLALAVACGGDVDDDEGTVAISEIPLGRRSEIPVRLGYIDGKRVEYYDFGTFVPDDESWFPAYDEFPGMPTNPIYVFQDGARLSIEQQHPIIDKLPLQANYSDFFEIVAVIPPDGYTPNDIKSRATLLRAGYELGRTGRVLNCPVVGPKAELGSSSHRPRATFQRIEVWYRKKHISCIALEGGEALLSGGAKPPRTFEEPVGQRRDYRVAASEQYALLTSAFASPDRVDEIAVPDNAVFRYPPSSTRYTPLAEIFDVKVPVDYQVGKIASYADLFPVPGFTDPRIEERSPAAFCNCPIRWMAK